MFREPNRQWVFIGAITMRVNSINEEPHMHATLAYLNAAGRRAARLTPSNGAFMRVMDTLLVGAQGARPRKKISQRSIRKTAKAG
jgi:hypothetical protein